MLDLIPTRTGGTQAVGAEAGFAWTLLPRHGRRPLGFDGRLLLQAASRPPGFPVWSELAVHETARGMLVAAIRHRPPDDAPPGTGRHPWMSDAAAGTDAGALLDWLRAHDPVAHLPAWLLQDGGAGTPLVRAAGPGLAAALRASWRALLAATFGAAGAAASHDDPDAGAYP
ncbi:hypothetical protein E2C05_28980 [Paracraurococcus ruber]|uniref:hypothetical protein n=1 Tax=Paracraurococcus ruber TaxID=77675 RepID=UPI001057D425|nr:hypothetical protein [Paracraurococcus ruber]TDG16697.1 hypothetical protein E2C05_28980 [Paracraurococcus ruber]